MSSGARPWRLGAKTLSNIYYYFSRRAPCICVFTHECARPVSSLDMYAPCPHTASAPMWVAGCRPQAIDLGGLSGGSITQVMLAVAPTSEVLFSEVLFS
jgi:hypothetical protein